MKVEEKHHIFSWYLGTKSEKSFNEWFQGIVILYVIDIVLNE